MKEDNIIVSFLLAIGIFVILIAGLLYIIYEFKGSYAKLCNIHCGDEYKADGFSCTCYGKTGRINTTNWSSIDNLEWLK